MPISTCNNNSVHSDIPTASNLLDKQSSVSLEYSPSLLLPVTYYLLPITYHSRVFALPARAPPPSASHRAVSRISSPWTISLPPLFPRVRVVMSAHGYADSHDKAATMDDSNNLKKGSASPDATPMSTTATPDATHVKTEPDNTNKPASASPQSASGSGSDADPAMKTSPDDQETIGGDILKQEPGQPPKLSRSSSQKVVPRPPQLFDHLPNSTQDALATFEQIDACWYANKYMGYTEHAMECDCAEEWGKFGSCK